MYLLIPPSLYSISEAVWPRGGQYYSSIIFHTLAHSAHHIADFAIILGTLLPAKLSANHNITTGTTPILSLRKQ